MRLIVHAGLHKTGSTYLQHVMNDNAHHLASRGVYYEKQVGYPAHHFAAWDILRGDPSAISRMVAAARNRGCHTVILSSEDLEGAIFDHSAANIIEAQAVAEGVTEIEWHLCLRDPGETFASLYSQLQHHVFADATSLLYEALRDGLVMILDPLRGKGGTPFWCFCFDHVRYLEAFAARSAFPLYVHDFRAAQPFPGWGILDACGVLDVIQELPGAQARNSRLPNAEIRDGYVQRLSDVLAVDKHRERLASLAREQIRRNLAASREYSQMITDSFGPSTAEALEAFGYAPRTQGNGPIGNTQRQPLPAA